MSTTDRSHSAAGYPQRESLPEPDCAPLDAEFKKHRPRLLRLCQRILNGYGSAEDAAQEAYLHARRAWPRFQGTDTYGWLHRIAKNVCIDTIRARLPLRSMSNLHDSPTVDGEAQILTEIQVRDLLATLPQGQRECLMLTYLDGYSAKEVAAITGYSDNQVRSHLQNGRRNFKIAAERGAT